MFHDGLAALPPPHAGEDSEWTNVKSVIAPWLVAASAAIILLLGLIHLLYTFHGPKLLPRDRELHVRMQEVSPVITRQTTMWKAGASSWLPSSMHSR